MRMEPESAVFIPRFCYEVAIFLLRSPKCEKLHTEKSRRNAQDRGKKIAEERGIAQEVVKEKDDEILDDIVWDVREGEAQTAVKAQRLGENEGAV
jgi:hypothetical protein